MRSEPPPDPAPCDEPWPPDLAVAVTAFNRGAYLSCHEYLEALWLAEKRPVRDLYQGFLQLAVALHHEEQGNRAGALRLLQSGRLLLAPFAPACLGLDVSGLLGASAQLLARLEVLPASERLPDSVRPVAVLGEA